jgi:molybdopterin molybdotransferase
MSPDFRALISLNEAWQTIGTQVRPGSVERVPLTAAHGRVLAEPVRADADYPAFDKAMMDGFAVRSTDAAVVPCALNVIGEIPAGGAAERAVGAGEAMRINTGAPLPAGADAVVPVEKTEPVGENRRDKPGGSSTSGGVYPRRLRDRHDEPGGSFRIRILQNIPAWKHVARRGSDVRAGDVVLEPGLRLGAAQLAAAATAGAATLAVYRRPTVAIVSTGDELVPVDAAGLNPAARKIGQIYDSNGPTLAALTRECGGEPAEWKTAGSERDRVGSVNPAAHCIVPDRPDALRAALTAALEHPVVVTVGGMSMGTLDLVPRAFADLGVRWVFHGVDMRPGKPVAYGLGPRGQHVFGLPGNPVSCYVCFLLFVRMALDGLQGLPSTPPVRWPARLEDAVAGRQDARPAFLPSRIRVDPQGGLVARTLEWHGSGDPFGPALANGFVFQPDGTIALNPGDTIDVLWMPGCIR